MFLKRHESFLIHIRKFRKKLRERAISRQTNQVALFFISHYRFSSIITQKYSNLVPNKSKYPVWYLKLIYFAQIG